jgi:hypothetical protein
MKKDNLWVMQCKDIFYSNVFSNVYFLKEICVYFRHFVGRTPPAWYWMMVTSLAACSSFRFVGKFGCRTFIILFMPLCHPSMWLEVLGPSV